MSASIQEQIKDHPKHHASTRYTNVRLVNASGSDLEASTLGYAEMEICSECPNVTIKCLHETCSWTHLPDCDGYSTLQPLTNILSIKNNPPKEFCTGCLLKCGFCGADCT